MAGERERVGKVVPLSHTLSLLPPSKIIVFDQAKRRRFAMAKKVATRRELLVRWRGIEEVIGDGGDDVLPDTPKRRRLQRLKEDWWMPLLLPHGVSIVFVFTLCLVIGRNDERKKWFFPLFFPFLSLKK